MPLLDSLLGRPLTSDEDSKEKIGAGAGIPIFGLDALGSAAYGPEAALTLLIPLGAAGIGYIFPIIALISLLLLIVYCSYYQTIGAYPSGGGSYTVARKNLGTWPGLLAAAALMIDYVLVVAVGISAGVGALVSAVPDWQPFMLPICIAILAAITMVNLRGVRDTGAVFLLPTYLFVGCLCVMLILGIWRVAASDGHPIPVIAPPKLGAGLEAVSLWLLLKAFSSGCTAMTGVEAVSNGVSAFRDPRSRHARITLTIIITVLIVLLIGIGYLCRAYGIGATPAGEAGDQSTLSQLLGAICGKGWFYYVTIGSILLVLSLQANTAFADFPRLCRIVALDGFLPRSFAVRGRRLVYSRGIYALAFLSAVLLTAFGGVTDRLIPLFAIGAFLAFTLSQAGMVGHWKKHHGSRARLSMSLNGLGAVATGITVIVVAVAKFSEGAWATIFLIAGMMVLMLGIRRHYRRVQREIAWRKPMHTDPLKPPLVVIPMHDWNKISEKALRFAVTLSPEVTVLQIDAGDGETEISSKQWQNVIEEPARQSGLPLPQLVVVKSPYRFILSPILNYIFELEQKHTDRFVAVILPTMVESRWYYHFLHNQVGNMLTALLLLKGKQRVIIINVPWYLQL